MAAPCCIPTSGERVPATLCPHQHLVVSAFACLFNTCFSPCAVPCHFSLIARHAPGERRCGKQALVMWWRGVGRGVFCGPTIRPKSLVKSVPLAVTFTGVCFLLPAWLGQMAGGSWNFPLLSVGLRCGSFPQGWPC